MEARDAALDSIHGRLAMGILMAGQALGADMRQVAARAGIDLARMALDPDASVPVDQMVCVWEELTARTNDPLVGIAVASKIPLGVLGFVYHTLHASERLRDAVQRGMRYQRLVAGPLRTTLVERGDDAVVVLETQGLMAKRPRPDDAVGRSVVPFATEQHILLLNLRALSSVLGAPLVPRRVTFGRAWVGDAGPLERAFGGPVVFSSDQPTSLCLARADLDKPIPSGDPQLARWLDAQADQRLAAQQSTDLLVRMRMAIKVALSQGEPGLDQVAALVQMSARTLQRKLQTLETTLSAEVDAVRREVALTLMAEKNRPVTEVAFLVGYTELSAFYRAFRRWTDVTPVEWRNGARPTAAQ